MKILVRLPNWLGDVIMGTAFIHALKERYPDAIIHVITKKELTDVVACIPNVHQIHPFSKEDYRGLKGAWLFGKQLKGIGFDLFFSLPDSFSSAIMGYASGAKVRIGFKKEMRSFLLTDVYKKPTGLHRTYEYLELLQQFTGKAIEHVTVGLIPPSFATPNQLLLINFNSEASSRRMPLEKAISLTQTLLEAFPDKKIGFIGAPKEAPYIHQIIHATGREHRINNFAGKTSLKELITLLTTADVLLTTDSGPAHLANALGTPCVVLFGAGNEHNTAPFNDINRTVIRADQLPCEPCVKNTCKLYDLPECMNLLPEKRIVDELKFFLENDKRY